MDIPVIRAGSRYNRFLPEALIFEEGYTDCTATVNKRDTLPFKWLNGPYSRITFHIALEALITALIDRSQTTKIRRVFKGIK